MKERQQASRVFVVEPTHFGYNSQTAHSNAFQKSTSLAPEQIQEQALAEFRNFVAQLKEVGIEVYALKSSAKTPLPDAVFPITGLVYTPTVLWCSTPCSPKTEEQKETLKLSLT